MSNMNALLSKRLNQGEQSTKMAEMAKRSASGNLNNFAGMFSVSELTSNEKSFLETLLKTYALDQQLVEKDLLALISLTAEVKAINNQAALLHGERIKKAHDILIRYKEGAFSSWLTTTYGNRQTPYNLMQYYEFCEKLPKSLRPQIESMPRQAIYALASREGNLQEKIELVTSYSGQTKAELLIKIREAFPLNDEDKRRENVGQAVIQRLEAVSRALQRKDQSVNTSQRQAILRLVLHIQELLHE